MKKYIIFSLILGLLFTACNPNKAIYDDIENNAEPYSETGLEYTLTSSDYSFAKSVAKENATNEEDSIWASYIEQYNSFNTRFSAYKYIPSILEENFPALKEGSNIVVTYNQYIGEMYGDIQSSELTDVDYTNIGGDIATNHFFSNTGELDSILSYLLTKFPNAEANNYAEVFYKYPDLLTTAGGFYKFNGYLWTLVDNSRVLVPEDYSAMGAPGEHNNFSDDSAPGNYLPQFLNLKYPYAQEGDEMTVLCHLFQYESTVYAIPCEYTGSEWSINFPGKKTVSQFKHDGEVWYFDPTQIFTMSSSDYQLIVDYVTGNPDIPNGYLDDYHPESTEYYYGANSYYNNFYVKLYKRRQYDPLGLLTNLSDDDALANIWGRIKEGIVVMLQQKYPNAVPSIEGLEVHYFVTFKVYDGGNYWYLIEYKCLSAGTPPTFELVTDAEDISSTVQ